MSIRLAVYSFENISVPESAFTTYVMSLKLFSVFEYFQCTISSAIQSTSTSIQISLAFNAILSFFLFIQQRRLTNVDLYLRKVFLSSAYSLSQHICNMYQFGFERFYYYYRFEINLWLPIIICMENYNFIFLL